ncbi:putative L-fuculokinase [uncultured Microbacterium sp.]|uniref:Putative L-fuculokinase n=2 Tax=uncultured Microbacterium sp. TaxID=191216 RepID=A0A1Y5P2W3_9MICO|nr:putative L-fuculokinase [uncultured Microbacterium sp.]
MSQVVIGIDFGSSRIKAAAYSREGEMVALEAVDTPLRRTAVGDDFPVLDMLDAACDVLSTLRGDSIAAVGLTSMGEVGTVVTGEALAPIDFPSWYDDRGGKVVATLEEWFGAERLRNLTARHLRTTSTVAKLGHVQSTSRDVPRGQFTGLCGALAYQLTGEVWQEAGLAATSGVYDLVGRRYIPELWASAGLAHVELPEVRPPGFGAPARGAVARSLRLDDGARVVIAGHDHPVAAVGSGVRVGDIFDSMGTGEAIISAFSATAGFGADELIGYLERDPDLSFEFWPSDGAPLAVWERMRPGLAMRTFLDGSDADRATLEMGAARPRRDPSFSSADLAALQAGLHVDGPRDAHAWGDLIDAYVLLANQGSALVRSISGAEGATVLTGGGLRSRRWREAKLELATGPIDVSTVAEAAARGCAAIAGAGIGWWPRPEDMPGATRLAVTSHREMDEAIGDTVPSS